MIRPDEIRQLMRQQKRKGDFDQGWYMRWRRFKPRFNAWMLKYNPEAKCA